MGEDHRRGCLVGPLLLVGFGVALLGGNFGWFRESLWTVLLRAWPVVLVAIGIDLLVPRRTVWGTLLSAVLIAGVLAGGLWLSSTSVPSLRGSSAEAVDVPLSAGAGADVEIRPSVGQLLLGPGKASGGLVEATIPLLAGERLERRVEQAGSRQRVVLESQGLLGVVPGGRSAGLPWKVLLNPQVPTTLEIGMGVGEILVDGVGLNLSRLKAQLGVGHIEVRLGSGVESLEVDLGIGQVVVVVPSGSTVRIEANVALGERNLPAGFVREGDWYLSPGFATAEPSITIRANLAIGEITLRTGN